jgi:hypothetical protein
VKLWARRRRHGDDDGDASRAVVENDDAKVVGDITPGIPKYPFIMTNIYIIYQVIYVEILKSK